MKKRSQHYIWQFYLAAWLDGSYVWCLRDKVFPCATKNIAHLRDFYKLKRITDGEKNFLLNLIWNVFPRHMVNIHLDILRKNTAPFSIEDYLVEKGLVTDEAKKWLEKIINNTEEDFHSIIEGGKAQGCLISLRNGDMGFWEDIQLRIAFLHFLALQYFRTKNIQDEIYSRAEIFSGLEDAKRLEIDLKRMWGVQRQMLAMNVANSLYKDPAYGLVVLENESDVGFIAGDSVAINTYGAEGKGEELLEFYYPVSPRFAVLVTDKKYSDSKVKVGADVVHDFNVKMLDSAREMVFSNNRDQLEGYSEHFLSVRAKPE